MGTIAPMKAFNVKCSLLLALAGALSAQQAKAWGAEGHRIVADAAYEQLSHDARTEADRLLALEPGATLPSISTWADEVRSPTTAAWHYANFPRDADCRYDPDKMCVAGNCVVGAIERQAEVLRSERTDEVRLKALKWLVHLVADVHQPLHAGFADDKGGNQFQVHAFGRGTNLHAVWDSGLIANWPAGPDALKDEVRSLVRTDNARTPGAATGEMAARWAEASCRVAASPEFYPSVRRLGGDYVARWSGVLEQQLATAAGHLAEVLSQALRRPGTTAK